MKLLIAVVTLGLGGCLVIEDGDEDVRYYRPGSRYVARPYVDAQQYYAPGVRPRYYRRPYVAPADAYDDRQYVYPDSRRRYYRGDDD